MVAAVQAVHENWVAGEVLAVSIEEELGDALGEEAGGQRLVVDGEELWVMIQRT